MANSRNAVCEQLIVRTGASRLLDELEVHSVGAEEGLVLRRAFGERPHHQLRSARREESVFITILQAEQGAPDLGQVHHPDPHTPLGREDRGIGAGRIGVQIARLPLRHGDRAGGRQAVRSVSGDLAGVAVERDGARLHVRAATDPVEAGLHAQGREHQPLDQKVISLAARRFQCRGDDGRAEIGIFERRLARRADLAPCSRVGELCLEALAERDGVTRLV